MQQDFAVETVKHLALSSSGTVIAVTMGLGEQLNASHQYLNLQLPYWVFLVSMIILNFIGAFFALKTDYMQANGSKVGNFSTAVLVGFVLSFVVLPVANPTSSVGLMQIASFISGLCGTILLRVVINIMNRQDLQDAIVELVVTNSIKLAGVVVELFTTHITKTLTTALIGVVASLVLLPSFNNEIGAKSVSQPTYLEVTNDYHG